MSGHAPRGLTGKKLHQAVLRFIAHEEPLLATLSAFPQLDRKRLERILGRAAGLLEAREERAALVRAPPLTRVRVYSDGAARGNPGLAGAGAVLVEPSGQVVDRLSKFLGHQTNHYADYIGLLLGLERAKALGVAEVEVFADSELMLRQLGGRYQVRSPLLKPLYQQALRLLRDFERVKFVQVPREMNRAAEELSLRAIDERP